MAAAALPCTIVDGLLLSDDADAQPVVRDAKLRAMRTILTSNKFSYDVLSQFDKSTLKSRGAVVITVSWMTNVTESKVTYMTGSMIRACAFKHFNVAIENVLNTYDPATQTLVLFVFYAECLIVPLVLSS